MSTLEKYFRALKQPAWWTGWRQDAGSLPHDGERGGDPTPLFPFPQVFDSPSASELYRRELRDADRKE